MRLPLQIHSLICSEHQTALLPHTPEVQPLGVYLPPLKTMLIFLSSPVDKGSIQDFYEPYITYYCGKKQEVINTEGDHGQWKKGNG